MFEVPNIYVVSTVKLLLLDISIAATILFFGNIEWF